MCPLTKSSAESLKSLAACLRYDTVPISHGKSIHTSMASVKITLRSKSWRVYLGIVLQRLELLKRNSLYIESKSSNVGLHIIFSLQTWLFLRPFSFHEARSVRKLFTLNNRLPYTFVRKAFYTKNVAIENYLNRLGFIKGTLM